MLSLQGLSVLASDSSDEDALNDRTDSLWKDWEKRYSDKLNTCFEADRNGREISPKNTLYGDPGYIIYRLRYTLESVWDFAFHFADVPDERSKIVFETIARFIIKGLTPQEPDRSVVSLRSTVTTFLKLARICQQENNSLSVRHLEFNSGLSEDQQQFRVSYVKPIPDDILNTAKLDP